MLSERTRRLTPTLKPCVGHRREQIQLWMPSNQGQLGGEGFIMGTLCLSFGLCVSALTYVVPRLPSSASRQGAAWSLLLVAAVAYYKIVSIYTWKTGYRCARLPCIGKV